MTWQHIVGHDKQVENFQRAAQRGRLAGSFLFIGPDGIGKRRFAFALAKALLCKGCSAEPLIPCGECPSCKLFSGSQDITAWEFGEKFRSPHPDLYYVCKPEDKSFLPLELILGAKSNRGKEGLIYDISRTPFLEHRKAAIINDADFFNAEVANSLLKTLEEPPPNSVLILIGSSTAKQLPTIRSRCQIVRFSSLPDEVLAELLLKHNVVGDKNRAAHIAAQSGGSVTRAKDLLDGAADTIRTDIHRHLSSAKFDAIGFAAEMNTYIDYNKGDEPAVKRRRLRVLLELSAEFFRSQMHHPGNAKSSARKLARTLEAAEHTENNASIPIIVEAWSLALTTC